MKPRNLLLLFCFTLIGNGFSVSVNAKIFDNTYSVEQKTSSVKENSAKPCHNNKTSNTNQLNTGVEPQPILVCDCCDDLSCAILDVCSLHLSTGITSQTTRDIQQNNVVINNSTPIINYLSLPRDPLDHKPKQ